jgi:hypothetical protein
MTATHITRPTVPPAGQLRHRLDGSIVHVVAELKLSHATGTIRRHVGPDGDVAFTGEVDSVAKAQWIDDTTAGADAAEAWAFVIRELDAMERHPAGRGR